MCNGISDSIIATFIINIVRTIWNLDIINKIKLYVLNPQIYIRFSILKKYETFEFDLIEIKKLLFSETTNNNYPLLNSIDYLTHGKNYLNFTINKSGASYLLEIINDVTPDNITNENEYPTILLKIKSNTSTLTHYRECSNNTDLKVINQIYDKIEKEYKLIKTFSSYELISSSDKNVRYPKRNVYKCYDETNEIIYDNKSIAIKSMMNDELLNCLNKYKLKLFKNQEGKQNEYDK